MEDSNALRFIDYNIYQWRSDEKNRGIRPEYVFVSRKVWYDALMLTSFNTPNHFILGDTFFLNGVKVTWAPDFTDDQIKVVA